MSKRVIGAEKLMRNLDKFRALAAKYQRQALQKNGEEVIRTAKILVPKVTGTAVSQIEGRMQDDGYMMDFGPKAKVIEGKRGPRPFVNPALKATLNARIRRNKAAIARARREAMRG